MTATGKKIEEEREKKRALLMVSEGINYYVFCEKECYNFEALLYIIINAGKN